MLKRQRARVRQTHGPHGESSPLLYALGYLHLYAVLGFGEGVRYQAELSRASGATKGEILDTLAVASLHAGSRGIASVRAALADHLRDFKDPAPVERYPPGWSFDPHAFDSGMDYSVPHATPEDMKLLRDWHLRTVGEVPGYVEFLSVTRPDLLKAFRDRMEHAIRDGLPKQMLPYMWLQMYVVRGCRDGIRESALLGRAMGMRKGQLVEAVSWGMSYGGSSAVSIVNDAAGDVISGMA